MIRRGGELGFFEHVRGEGHGNARAQSIADRSGVWPLLAGGCHCARDTVGSIEHAGFTVAHRRALNAGPAWGITNPHVLGVALRP